MVQRGRPRVEKTQQAILNAALEEAFKVGFRALTIDTIASQAGVAKTTIYRRWPNKAAVVMDAFLSVVGPSTEFPKADRALERMRLQLHSQAEVFSGEYGKLVKLLLGEAQFDVDVAQAFRERWTIPRRRLARVVIEDAIEQGDLRPDIDAEIVIDLLYGPIYYRLQIGTAPISKEFVDSVFSSVIEGLRPR